MKRRTSQHLSGTVIGEQTVFTLRELCSACGVQSEVVIEMVEEGVLDPRGRVPSEWRFTGRAVIRAQKALKLTRDLEVNWPGAALALDLLEEIEQLRLDRRIARYRIDRTRPTRR
ncbi:MAG: chaperone modulator CbpM [Gammaproteobacteria bacterium]|nr:chaperone modulator CbpM [Gammaproteobacteria bacterium]MDE0365227.1 chaperone modulator CbpM [Gammaproteobacteria bacterium]